MTKVFLVLFLLASTLTFSQEKTPTRTADQKLTVRDAQHKLDTIDKQIAAFQQQATAVRAQALAELDKAVADFKAGVDEKKWQLNPDTLSFSEVPSTNPPAKTEEAKK